MGGCTCRYLCQYVCPYTCQCFSIHQAEPVGLFEEEIAVSDDNGLSQCELLKKVTSDY